MSNVGTYEVDNEAAVGATASGAAEERFAVGELSDDRELEGAGEEEISGVG